MILLTIWTLIFIKRKDLQDEMLLISLLFTIFGASGHFFFGNDWRPHHILTLFNSNLGFEDFIYAFSISGIGAVSYETFLRKFHKKKKRRDPDYIRKIEFLLSGTAGVALFLFVDQLTNWNLTITSGVGLTFTGITIAFFRNELLKALILNAIIFTGLIFMVEVLTAILFPGFTDLWIDSNLIGIRILNIPIEEFIFHFGWGMAIGSLYELYYGLIDE